MISGLPSDVGMATLIGEAFAQWAPEAEVRLSPLSPGYSGSSVYRVDVKGARGRLRSGRHILKLTPKPAWNDQVPEFEAHARACERHPEFAREHIPSLIAHHPVQSSEISDLGYAMLFEIAGGSLDRFSPADGKEDGKFLDCAGSILKTLLRSWSDEEPSEQISPRDLMDDLCGYRLDKEQAPELHEFVRSLCPETIFVEGGEILVNPLSFVSHIAEHDPEGREVLRGLMHGDLHGGNVLLHRLSAQENPFYVIDFAFAREGPVGYDAAYLELSHVLAALGDEDPARLIGALRRAENPTDTVPLPPQSLWTMTLISSMREALAAWRKEEHPYRADQIDAQLALCRVAAGINWANKPLKPAWRVAALCFAGWAARGYLKLHAPSLWASLTSKHSGLRVKGPDDDALWSELWQSTNGFDPNKAKFILVAERLN